KVRGIYGGALQAPAGSREGPSPLPIRSLNARLDPVLPDCEPRLKHGGHYDVAAVTRARQFRAAQKASQVVARRSPKPRAKRNSEVRSGLNRAIPQTRSDCLT